MTDGPELSASARFAAEGSSFTEGLAQAAYLLGDNPILVVQWHSRRIMACNQAVRRVFGYEPGELIDGTTRVLHVSDEAFEEFGSTGESEIMDTGSSFRCRYRMQRRDGTVFPTDNLVQVLLDGDRNPIAAISVIRDLTEHDPGDTGDSRGAADLPQSLLMKIPGAMFQRIQHPDGGAYFTYFSGVLVEDYGVDAAAAARDAGTIFDMVDPADRPAFEDELARSSQSMTSVDTVIRFHTPKGGKRWLRILSTPWRRDDGAIVRDGIAIDITRERSAQGKAHWLATHDPLTGLLNREQFMDKLHDAVARSAETTHRLAIASVDIRGMLHFNASYGLEAGDDLIRRAGLRLRESLLDVGTVARSHSDVFLVLLYVADTDQDLARAIEAIRSVCSTPFEIGDRETTRIELSIGVARYPDDARSAEELVRSATLATERARSHPELPYEFYTDDVRTTLMARFDLETRLRSAITEGSIEPHFQPQISLEDGSVVGFEALVRWPLADGSWIPPADFIPLAEETGLVTDLGALMLRKVSACLREWQRQGLPLKPVAVNCSARQFRAAGFVDTYRREVIDAGTAAETVSLEITESTLVEDFAATQRTMQQLSEMGVRFSIDDFGTGFSALGYMTRLPFDALKIDRSFVHNVTVEERQQSMIRVLVNMASVLDMYVVAEGVETAADVEEMRKLGCDAVQGFHYSGAVPAREVPGWLR